jgi:DNA-binding transcriptional LysR family regulator
MLERHEIEAFLTLAVELHFGRSAERLHVSTARVSQTIKRLEVRIGAPLFVRTSRRVELTDAGHELNDAVRPAWRQIAAAVEQAREAATTTAGRLEVAFTGAAGGQLLTGAAELLQRRHPECEVRVREAQLGEVLPWIRDGSVDLALTTFPVAEAGLSSGPVLVSEGRALAVPTGHPLARRESVSLADLNDLDVLQSPGDASTLNELLTLVGAGRGVLPVGAQARRYYARPDVSYVPFSTRAFARAAQDLLR